MLTPHRANEAKYDSGSEDGPPPRKSTGIRSAKLRRSLDSQLPFNKKPPSTPPRPAPIQQQQHQGGFLRQLYDARFPLDSKGFCNLVLVAVRAQPASTTTTSQRNASPGVSVTEILHVFSTVCGLRVGQNTANRCMSFLEFERGLMAVSRVVFQAQPRPFLRFHDAVLLPFAYNIGVVPMASFHPVVLTWIRRPDVHAVLKKLFATCTQKARTNVVQIGDLEKVLLSLRMYPAQVSRRKLKHCFRSVLLACTLVKRAPVNDVAPCKAETPKLRVSHRERQRAKARTLQEQYYNSLQQPTEQTMPSPSGKNNGNSSLPEGLTFPGLVECICRCVSAGTTAHKNRKMAIHDLSAIASALQLIGCAYCLKHGISFNFVARLEVDKAVRNAAGCIDLDSEPPTSPHNLEPQRETADPETLRSLLRRMPSPAPLRGKTPPASRTARKPKDDASAAASLKTPQARSKRRSSTGSAPGGDGLTVSKSEYDIVVAKLNALEQALDMDLGKVDWDGTLDDAETKMQATVPRLMSDDPEEQAAAQEEFEMLDKIIRNHADYKERERRKSEEWEEENRDKNLAALAFLKQLFPETITKGGVTQDELVSKHNLSRALARRLFSSKVLRFVHMEAEVISKTHIADLTGVFSTQGLDIRETRAIYACLPAEFQSDGDGRKEAWRCTLRETLKSLCDKEAKGQLTANQKEHSAYRPPAAPKPRAPTPSPASAPALVGGDSAGNGGDGGSGVAVKAPMSLMAAIAARKGPVVGAAASVVSSSTTSDSGGGSGVAARAPISLMAAIAARKEPAMCVEESKVSSTTTTSANATSGGGASLSFMAAIQARSGQQTEEECKSETNNNNVVEKVAQEGEEVNQNQQANNNNIMRQANNMATTTAAAAAAAKSSAITQAATTSSSNACDPALENGRDVHAATAEMRGHHEHAGNDGANVQRRLVFDSQDTAVGLPSDQVAIHGLVDTNCIRDLGLLGPSAAVVQHRAQSVDGADAPALRTEIHTHVGTLTAGEERSPRGCLSDLNGVATGGRSVSAPDLGGGNRRSRAPPPQAPTVMGALRAALRVRRAHVDAAAGDVEGLAEVAAAERVAAAAEARRACPPTGGTIKAIAKQVALTTKPSLAPRVDHHIRRSDSVSVTPVCVSAGDAPDTSGALSAIKRAKSLSLVDELATVLARRRDAGPNGLS